MGLSRTVAAVRAGWWLLLVGLVIGGGVALAVSLLETPTYTSSTEFFVSTTDSTSTSLAFQGSQLSQQRAASYAKLITGEDLSERVVKRLGLDMSSGKLRGELNATVVPDTVLIDVTVTDSSPERAQSIAEAVGTEFPALVAQLESPAGGGVSPVKVTVTDRPNLPSASDSRDIARKITAGALLGLVVGASLAAVRASLDRSVKNAEQVIQTIGVPVLGHIMHDESLAKRHVIDRWDASRTAENFRQLRNNLQWLNVDSPPTVIMVTSAVPEEGKTTAVLNLALALADAGRKVTILETDLRKPKVADYLGIAGGTGLSNVLAGTADLTDVIQRYGDRDVWILPAGPMLPNPGEVLASRQMEALIDKLRGDNDYVLVDAAPVLPVADSSGLAAHMDGVLLSVRYGSTRTEQLWEAAATLEGVRGNVLGVILNIVPPKADVAEWSAYGYRHFRSSEGP